MISIMLVSHHCLLITAVYVTSSLAAPPIVQLQQASPLLKRAACPFDEFDWQQDTRDIHATHLIHLLFKYAWENVFIPNDQSYADWNSCFSAGV
jgi:hypothetical protein